jgi:putative ABC transport system permease protein
VPFTIIGVLERKGQRGAGSSQDDVVLIPLSSARSRVLGAQHEVNRRAVSMIVVKVEDSLALSETKANVKELLHARHRLRPDAPDDFTIVDPADLLATQKAAMKTATRLLMAIAAISLIVGGISIMNIMLVSVTERTREIGLRMAVGARRLDIANQFLVEAVIIALAGGAFGAALGVMVGTYLALANDWPLFVSASVMSPLVLFVACAVSSAVGLGFGCYPAYRASRLDPMIALRFE